MSRRTRQRLAAAGAGAAVTFLGVGLAIQVSAGDDAPEDLQTVKTAWAPITRGDMSVSESLSGTLGYARKRTVPANAAGVVTGVARHGTVLTRGEPLVEVDEVPVLLMYGSTPMYRDLVIGSEGADVVQLERNLRALGFGEGLEVDEEFTSWTAHQVREWQEDAGLNETGTVSFGSVVFLPGPQRISKLDASVGSSVQPGMPLLSVSSAEQVVTVAMPVDSKSLAKVGQRVRVLLPGHTSVRGVTSRVGSVVSQPASDEGDPTVQVLVRLRKKPHDKLDSAPVEVLFESERRDDVLSVPVTALMASGAGRYFVELKDGSGYTRISVELGIFSDGRVEVDGEGLMASQMVRVPA